jgi:gamma-glutamyltranspeptidase/glutathione hydrolase
LMGLQRPAERRRIMSRLKLTNNSTRRSGPRRSRLLTPRFLITLLALAGMGTSLLGPLGSSTAWAKEGSRFETMSTARSPYGVVASASEQASRVGIDVLNRGGNAVDAAVATIFAVGVTRPDFNSIGGGGFLVYRSRTGEVKALDFREYAPMAVTPTTFQGEGMHKNPLGGTGYLPIGVPGTVAGMAEAHRVLGSGKFTLADLIGSGAVPTDPPSRIRYAHELARDGIDVTFELAFFAFLFLNTRPYFSETMRIYGSLDALYFAKEKLKQEDYANSLKLIMEFGPEAFYQVKEYDPAPGGLLPRKSIAKLIVEDMETTGQAYGALMKKEDLSEYQAKWRTPLVSSYRGHQIIAMPPPTSGGIATIEILNLLEGFPLGSTTGDVTDTAKSWAQSSANHLHHLAEAQKIAWADRDFFVGDPDFVDVPTAQLIEKGYADKRRPEIKYEAKPEYPHSSEPWATPWPRGANTSGMHTTHVSVIDRDGNAGSVTNSINSSFGSAVVARGTGFPLNDTLGDFNMDDPGTANAPGPRKRPRSSNSPTIIARDGRAFLVTGGTGGPYTPLGAVQNIVNMVDFRLNLAQAIDAERIDARAHGKECVEPDGTPSDVQGVPNCPKGWTNKLTIEHVAGAKQRFDNAVLDALIARGHALNPTGEYGGGLPLLEAVAWNPDTGYNEAASDPRHNRNFDNPPRDEERGAAGQPELPDLRVTGIAASNNRAREGEKVTITATIANTGSAPASASKTEFLIDGATALGLVDTLALPASGTATVSVKWDTRSVKGEHTVRVTADKTGLVVEGNEDNNATTFTFTVKGNKITNGSFEQSNASGTGPAGWSGSNTGAGTTLWSGGGSDGSRSVSLSGSGGNAVLAGSPRWTSDAIAVIPGEVLSLVVSARSDGASSPASAGLIYLDANGNVLGTVTALSVPLTTGGFVTLEQSVTIPAGVAQVRVVLMGFAPTDTATAGSVTFDEVGLFGN